LDGEDSQNADAEEAAKEEEYTPAKVLEQIFSIEQINYNL
jgi:hypothetical protein